MNHIRQSERERVNAQILFLELQRQALPFGSSDHELALLYLESPATFARFVAPRLRVEANLLAVLR